MKYFMMVLLLCVSMTASADVLDRPFNKCNEGWTMLADRFVMTMFGENATEQDKKEFLETNPCGCIYDKVRRDVLSKVDPSNYDLVVSDLMRIEEHIQDSYGRQDTLINQAEKMVLAQNLNFGEILLDQRGYAQMICMHND